MTTRLLLVVARLVARPLTLLGGLTAAVIIVARASARHIGPHPTRADALRFNLLVVGVFGMATLVWAARAVARRTARSGLFGRPRATSQGSAQWGSTRALESPTGFILGRGTSRRHPMVRYTGDAHILTLAPTGAGKGVGCVIPNLLDCPGSALVIDPKGENYAVTAAYRRSIAQRVVALDPFDLVGGDAAFNPIEALEPDALTATDDAAALAEMLVMRDPRASADTVFWSEEAKALLTGLILHVAASETGDRRTLATMWEHLSLPPRGLTQLWTAMAHSTAAGGAVARAAARVRQKGERVRSGILAEAQSHIHFLESPRLAHVMRHSSFDFADLKRDHMTLYVVVPPDRMDSCRRWLRLMVAAALNALMRTPGTAPHRVLFLLDEFPALGPMPPLERAVSLARGYGATCWMLAQDLAQLQALYPTAWSTFVANAGVVQAFGTNDVETATYLSAMLGASTVAVATTSRSRRGGMSALLHGRDTRDAWSTSERGRPLLAPDEIRRQDPHTTLLLMPGVDPMRVTRVDYRHDPEFHGCFAANPMHGEGQWSGVRS
jgi:type IV secretion system protein VirD4